MHSCFSSRFRRGFIIPVLHMLAGPATIGITVGGWYSWRGEMEFREATAALEAAGYSTDPLSICPPEVPAEGNFGSAEPLQSVWIDEKDHTPEMTELHDALKALDFDESEAVTDDLRRPRTTAERATDWKAWRTWFRDGMAWDVPEKERDDARAVLLTLQDRSKDVIPILIEHAKSRKLAANPFQKARFLEAVRSQAPLVAAHAGAIFELVRFVSLQAEAASVCGDSSHAADLLNLEYALIELARSERSMGGFMIGLGLNELQISSVWRGVAAGVLTDEQLRLTQESIAKRQALKEDWIEVMHIELVHFQHHCDRLVRQRHPFSRMLFSPPSMQGRGSLLDAALCRAVSKRILALQIDRFLSMKRHLDGAAPVEYWRQTQREQKPWPAWARLLQPHGAMAELIGTAENFLASRAGWSYMKMGALQITCAIERHRLAGGAVPEKLNKLPAGLLPQIPLDMDGKPLRYRREGKDGWVIWSVGLDGKDDWNGVSPPPSEPDEEPRGAWFGPDWQWRLTRHPR